MCPESGPSHSNQGSFLVHREVVPPRSDALSCWSQAHATPQSICVVRIAQRPDHECNGGRLSHAHSSALHCWRSNERQQVKNPELVSQVERLRSCVAEMEEAPSDFRSDVANELVPGGRLVLVGVNLPRNQVAEVDLTVTDSI